MIRQQLQAFWIALQFFTVLPVPQLKTIDQRALANSVLYYPLVGLIIGVVLFALAYVLSPFLSSLLTAAVLLGVWVLITGALHLDGLADCADAWVGGISSKEKTLEIMKDPVCGPVGVTALVLSLLLKFTLIETLVSQQGWWWLLVVPVIARGSAMLMLLTTDYVREGGLGEVLSRDLSRNKAWFQLALLCTIGLGLWPVAISAVLCTVLLAFGYWRSRMIKRIGGCTGDTVGAQIELAELTALFALVLVSGVVTQ